MSRVAEQRRRAAARRRARGRCVLLLLHAAGDVEDQRDVRVLLVLAPEPQRRRPSPRRAGTSSVVCGSFGSTPCAASIGAAERRRRRIAGRKPYGSARSCCGRREQEVDVASRRLAVLGASPTRARRRRPGDRSRTCPPSDRSRRPGTAAGTSAAYDSITMFSYSTAALRYAGPLANILLAEEAGRAAVVDDRLLDVARRTRAVSGSCDVLERQPRRLARRRRRPRRGARSGRCCCTPGACGRTGTRPTRGWPSAAQPCGVARQRRARRSSRPACCRQPSASAIGFHIAMTTGESTRFSVGADQVLARSCARDCALPSLMNAADAGLVRCACRAPGEQLVDALARAHRDRRDRDDVSARRLRRGALKTSVVSLIHFSFSEP